MIKIMLIILAVLYIILGIIIALLSHLTVMKHNKNYTKKCKNHIFKCCVTYAILILFYPAIMIYIKLKKYVYSHDEW